MKLKIDGRAWGSIHGTLLGGIIATLLGVSTVQMLTTMVAILIGALALRGVGVFDG